VSLHGVVYYYTQSRGDVEYVRLHILCWFCDEEGKVVMPDDSLLPVVVDIHHQGRFSALVKSLEADVVDPVGFVSLETGVPWKSGFGHDVRNILRVVATAAVGTPVSLPLYETPSYLGPWAAVFFENLKLGVLHMTGQVQGLAELVNSITDKVRYALQVGPGETMRWCSDHTPALAPGWGDAVSWGFSSVGIWIHNFGDIPIEFSFDGQNRHGIVPAGKAKVYDFRRETQIYFRASATTPTITLEVW